MADDDLYGDLDTSADMLRAKSLEQELAATKEKCAHIEQQLAVLQRKEKSLMLENEQLARNISCLFNTANAEIARKDKWIDQLRRQLQEMEKDRSSDSRR